MLDILVYITANMYGNIGNIHISVYIEMPLIVLTKD